MSSPVSSFIDSLLSLLFPPVCQGCSAELSCADQPWLCSSCFSNLLFIDSPFCSLCGKPLPAGDNHLCGECLSGAFSFALARSLLVYNKALVELIGSFKYQKNLAALSTISALCMESGVNSWFHQPDFIIPVPLHISRLRQRSFNQSLLLARKCFPAWQHLVLSRGLVKDRATVPQVALSGKERRANLARIFKVDPALNVRGKSILLVDDVFTTGSTINACSKVLKRAGAAGVEVFTVARALSRADYETTFGKEPARQKKT